MRLYFRADTRSPKNIFSNGFQPKSAIWKKDKPWWLSGISKATENGTIFPSIHEIKGGWDKDNLMVTRGFDVSAIDANPEYVISMTTTLEAAPIFPVEPHFITGKNYDEIYVYVIALDDAKLPENFDSIEDTKKENKISVFDLHALQIQQSKVLLNNNPTYNPALVTQGLCGYEAFTRQVNSEDIICAVKCNRSNLQKQTAGLRVFTGKTHYAIPFERKFQLSNEIICNMAYTDDNQDEKLILKNEAIKLLAKSAKKGIQSTTNVTDALINTDIVYDKEKIKKSSLFWYQIKNMKFNNAILSLYKSVGSFFTWAWNGITRNKWFNGTNKDTIITHFDPIIQDSGVKMYNMLGNNNQIERPMQPATKQSLKQNEIQIEAASIEKNNDNNALENYLSPSCACH